MPEKINSLKVQIEKLSRSVSRFTEGQAVPQIEVDIALATTRDIYSILLELNHIEEKVATKTIEAVTPKKEADTIQKTSTAIPIPENETVAANTLQTTSNNVNQTPKTVFETEKPEAPEPENNSDTLLALETEATVAPGTKTPEVIENKEILVTAVSEEKTSAREQEIIAEKYKKQETLINEVLARGGKRDITSVLQSRPVKDIEAAIGINERFIFIRELFNGDAETYTKTIKILNSARNFNEAFNYMNQTFSWDFESESAHMLLDLVRRRFIN